MVILKWDTDDTDLTDLLGFISLDCNEENLFVHLVITNRNLWIIQRTFEFFQSIG